MKFRIVKKGESYYPQVRVYWFWDDIRSWQHDGFYPMSANSIEKAKIIITNYLGQKPETVWQGEITS